MKLTAKETQWKNPMRAERILLLTLACLPFLVFGCVSQPAPIETREFYFSSGGAYHFEGYGEWSILLGKDGSFAVSHNVQGEIIEYGPYILSAEENAGLWNLVDAAGVNSLKSSERPGIPDEVQYTLALKENGSRHEVQIWIGEVQEIENVTRLVDQIGVLIEAYTGQQPVMK